MPPDHDSYLEPDIHYIDASALYASAAISLKRIADSLAFFELLSKEVMKALANAPDATPEMPAIMKALGL
jgi:hypothetical protein